MINKLQKLKQNIFQIKLLEVIFVYFCGARNPTKAHARREGGFLLADH